MKNLNASTDDAASFAWLPRQNLPHLAENGRNLPIKNTYNDRLVFLAKSDRKTCLCRRRQDEDPLLLQQSQQRLRQFVGLGQCRDRGLHKDLG